MSKPLNECGYGYICGVTGQVQGICPKGWHLPSADEWNLLVNAVGGGTSAGVSLRSTSGWNSSNGTDAYGFNALPGGYKLSGNGTYWNEGDKALFWSSTEMDTNGSYILFLNLYNETNPYSSDWKDNYLSVRCVMNEE